MLNLLNHTFFTYALLGMLLVCLACSLIGPFVYVRRMSFLAGGISHSLLGGLGVAVFFGFNPIIGAIVGAIVSAFILGWVSIRFPRSEDTLISALWSGGMAIGMIFIALTPGYATNLMNYLFGNILLLSPETLIYMTVLNAALLVSIVLFYNPFLSISFDSEFSEIRGLPAKGLYYFFLVLLAITIVLLVQAVGMVLVIAFLTLPAAIAKYFASSVHKMMLLSFGIGIFSGICGLLSSYHLGWPSGASIILCLVLLYAGATLLVQIRPRS